VEQKAKVIVIGILLAALICSPMFGQALVSTKSWRQINSGLPVTVEGVLADGANWTQIDAGLARTAAGVSQVVVDPLSPSTVYAVGLNSASLFRSTDGGDTWAALPSITGVGALAIDPTNSSTLYAAVTPYGTLQNFYATPQSVVMKSTDAGRSWNSTGDGPVSVNGLAIDPQNDGIVYAMTNTAIFKSTDGGASWTAKTAGLPSRMLGGGQLVFDSGNTSVLYAGVNSAVYKSMDAGESWQMVSPQEPSWVPGGGIAADPANSSTIYAVLFTPTTPAPNGNLSRLYKTIDGGANWTASDTGLPGPVSSLVVDTDSSVYAAWSGGVVKSTDGGVSWRALDNGLPSVPSIGSLALVPGNPPTFFAGYFSSDGRGGVFKTADGGANWSDSSSGLTFLSVNALAVDPLNSETVYVAIGDGISKSTDSGQDWTAVHFPSPPAPGGPGTAIVPSILIDPHNSNVLYASFFSTAGCYAGDPFLRKSTDGGATWSNLGVTDCATGPQVFLAVDPNNSSTLFAAPEDDAGCNTDVYETTDGGADWNQSGYVSVYITALVLAPGNPPVLYTAANSIFSYEAGLYKSTDAAKTWTATGLTDPVTALAVDPANGNTIYAGTSKGLAKTMDAGVTWTLLHALPEGSSITTLAIHPKSGILYVGTSQSGVYRSTDGTAWISLNDGLPSLSIQALAVGSDESGTIYVSTAGGVFRMTDSPRQVFKRHR
jgi:photosystem II stability/assembly factor-like uncharacterized protein